MLSVDKIIKCLQERTTDGLVYNPLITCRVDDQTLSSDPSTLEWIKNNPDAYESMLDAWNADRVIMRVVFSDRISPWKWSIKDHDIGEYDGFLCCEAMGTNPIAIRIPFEHICNYYLYEDGIYFVWLGDYNMFSCEYYVALHFDGNAPNMLGYPLHLVDGELVRDT